MISTAMKPQPAHDAAELATVTRVEPGAQSEFGRRIIEGERSALISILISPAVNRALPDPVPEPGRGRRRWR